MPELTSGINQLIERIKQEGVDAGRVENERIVREAQNQAEQLLAEAKQKAEAMVADAQTQADEMRTRAESDLRLAVRDYVADFGQRIRRNLIQPAISDKVAETIAHPQFLQNVLTEICRDFIKEGGGSIEAVIPPDTKEALGAYFADAVSQKLAGITDVQLQGSEGLTGFRLRREGEGFTWDFTLEAIVSELAELVDPALKPFFALGHDG
ncbi:MAG: hypothetical protein QNK37_14415 [Acidobacteriota bacterium]|nr:hypothetical protein [Acidobacteriota bacterium]